MKIFSAAIEGLHLTLTEIEADILQGLPSFTIVGLGDTSIKEARERIRSALKKSGYVFPLQKKIVNLSPADIKKQGSHFDLPIAIGILLASGQIKNLNLRKIFCAGELMLSGNLRKVPGILPMTNYAKKRGFKEIFIPYQNRDEAFLVKGINIYPVKDLKELIEHLSGGKIIKAYKKEQLIDDSITNDNINFSDVYGHEIPKRALEIAASGGHHIALIGPPGTGKTMLAKAYPGIFPLLNEQDSMEVSMIYSITQNINKCKLPILIRPFRHVHHSTTSVTLMGGGNPLNIGEATLAHKGVLFLDEFAEFPRNILEELREPLQEGIIRLGRYGKTTILPASFQLIAAMNPCPCGYFQDSRKKCQCTYYQIKRYYKKISGPILDRIDLVSEVNRLATKKLSIRRNPESSSIIQDRVVRTRKIQSIRGILNSHIMMKDIKSICSLGTEANDFIKTIIQHMQISPRSYLSILKISRTIADMENTISVKKEHIAEAVQYKKDFIY